MHFKKIIIQIVGAGAIIALSTISASANLLVDGSFESVDSSGGDVSGAGASWSAYWGTFPTVFTTSQALPQTGTSAHDGINVLKMFGPFVDGEFSVGAFQTVAMEGGDVYSAKVYALDWTSDPLNGSAVVTLQFFNGDPNLGGALIGEVENTFAQTDFVTQNTWFEIALAGTAPLGTDYARFIISHLNNGSSLGAVFWDDASIEVAAVPIPAAAWLLVSGLLGMIGISRGSKAA